LGQLVLAVIKADIDAAARAAPAATGDGSPAFGQDGATVTAILPPGAPAGAAGAPMPGSSAAKLFIEGIVPDPQPGRFDDFSAH
jgi:hypothetical protein